MAAWLVPSVVALVSLACGLPVAAATKNWQMVIAGKNETIELDGASVSRSFGGATAWSRVKFDRVVRDAGGAFDSIRTQDRYDCASRRFTTLRRAYFHGDMLVREDPVSRQRTVAVEAGSVDERLLQVACQAAADGEMPARTDLADRSPADVPQGERPVAMYADLRAPAADQAEPRLTLVAVAEPVAPPEKPKLIVLPTIDKAAADQAAAGARQQRPAAVPAGKTREPAAAPERVAAPTLPATRPGATLPESESPADKRLRELHYATSGPRKATKKTRAGEPPATSPQQHASADAHIHWSYDGAGGPANWARLRGDYATCATGKRQSPIDIREGIRVNLEGIKFDYRPTQFRIIDNGHTVQVNVGAGMGLTVMGKRYELSQFHFHRPSEERVDGRVYDMAVHLVHRNEDGQLAVVAVLLEKGGEHPLIQTLWNNLPLERDMEVAPEEAIDLNKLLPENRAYWTYMGSLTTPPCTEGVLWMVLKQPVQVAPDQVAIFSRVYRNNARPVQAANGRLIKESR